MSTPTDELKDEAKKLSLITNHAYWSLVTKVIDKIERLEDRPRIKKIRQDNGADHVIITR